MSDKLEQQRPPLQYDEMLLSNAHLASHYYDSELRFSGYDTPKVLFSGVHGVGAMLRFQNDQLNPNKALMWFTPTAKLAATFGIRLEDDQPRYIIAVFPHETGDLGKWVFQETPGKPKPIYEYITNQDLSLNKVAIVKIDDLLKIPEEKRPGITTRNVLLETLNSTDEQQQELRRKLLSKAQKLT